MDFTLLLKLFARYRLAQLRREDPVEAQRRVLHQLVRTARNTRFGHDHDFPGIRKVEDFQDRVPLRRYEDFWEEYWREPFPRLADVSWPGTVPYFAVTSGTTSGLTKYIPCTRAMVRAQVRASRDILVHHIANRPGSRLFGGKGFMLGGSTALEELAPGIRCGDLSGIMAAETPRWIEGRMFPPAELALISDYEEKIDRLAPLSLREDIRAISGTPSWLLLFFDRLKQERRDLPQKLVNYYPQLELLVHGGVNFAPYRRRFLELLAGSRAETREVYPASEAFIAVADRGDGEGMRLIADNAVFYELVPTEELDSEAPTRHWLANLDTGVDYALVVSSCAGAWAYVIGDTVRFLQRDPPRLLVSGRTSYTLSAFGEHLIAEEIESAVAEAAAQVGINVVDFTVTPVFPQAPGERGSHEYLVEPGQADVPASAMTRFASEVDRYLRATNEDYDSHRAGDFGMAPPRALAIPPGTFAAWMKRRGQLGGQHKVPRIIHDPELYADLKSMIQ